jgi:hypothetical protein
MSIFSWAVSPEDFKNQLDNYQTLPVTQSYRGVSALMILFSGVLTSVLGGFGLGPSSAVYSLLLYGPLGWFVYKGHRWAIVLMMLLWTFEKGVQVASGAPAAIIAIVWWSIYMNAFFNAFRVERARQKAILILPV